jgi:hypothetical protein
MSVTISNCNEICNAPTNQSTAKMLYTFPKQPRFLKRKTILYFLPHLDVTSTMNSRIPSRTGQPLSDMVISTTSPKNFLSLLLLTPTTLVIALAPVPRRASASDKAGTE